MSRSALYMNLETFEPSQLQVITYPHPTLRYCAKPIRRVDALLQQVARRMLELMYEHRGVGLAATQVDLPIRLFVMNSSGHKGEGTERVLINPVISRPRGNEEAEEGCLSLPNVHGNVVRAKTIRLNAYDLSGNEIDEDATGYEARIIQHETDHLNGMLFIDRMNAGAVVEIAEEIDSLQTDFRSRQRTAELAGDAELIAHLAGWDSRYC
jgi:peptide deformylase